MFRYCVQCYNAEAEPTKKMCKECREKKESADKAAWNNIPKPSKTEIDRLIDAAQREEKRLAKIAQQNQ